MAREDVRKRNINPTADSDSDSDSSVEEIPRHPTFYEQLEAHNAATTGINISKIKIPLGRKLDQDELIDNFSVEEYDVPRSRSKSGETYEEDVVVIGDAGQAIFFSIPLTILLIGFDWLVHKQYRDEIVYHEIAIRAVKSFIPMCFMVYLTHPRSDWQVMQVVFFMAAVASGCFMVHSVNKNGYYHIMQRAPPLGTILIWSVIEMEIVPALATCAAIGGYTWYNGFSIL